MSQKTLRNLLLAALFEGAGAFAWIMVNPSEAANARLLGYSYLRLGLAGLVIVIMLALGWVIWRGKNYDQRIDSYLLQGDHLLFVQSVLLAGFINSVVSFMFSWLFIQPNLRPVIVWSGLVFLQFWLAVAIIYRKVYRQKDFTRRYRLLPSWGDLEPVQKKVLLVLLGMALIYFALFIPLNLAGANDEHTFSVNGGDEYVMYPLLTNMLTPGDTFSATLYHIFIYEQYVYGFPFYALSALVLLPVRLVAGPQFIHLTQLNLLLLRQFISVLPMILAALIMVYLATRFRKLIVAAALFILILSIPGVVRYDHNFWHPDALNLLFIVLTLYFLDRDRLRFGRNFYLAAFACGLSAATRFYGVFFFLAIAAYLAAGWIKRILNLRQTIGRGAIFAMVMIVTFLLAEPFIFQSTARAKFFRVMGNKQSEMAAGYGEPDPEHIYRTGWDAWLPFFQQDYAAHFFSIFLIGSVVAGTLYGKQRLFNGMLLAWVVAVTGYLVYFVVVKSTQYMLPLFVPFFAAAVSLPGALEGSKFSPVVRRTAWGLVILLCLAQLAIQLSKLPIALQR
jgi:hypothetical protein